MEKAGMILIGKTNMDEFAMGSTTETSAFGITRNPGIRAMCPAVLPEVPARAVAAGEAYLALGSDTGGSIRQPRRVLRRYGDQTHIRDRVKVRPGGVRFLAGSDRPPWERMRRTCAALLEVIAGHDPKDSTSLKRKIWIFRGDEGEDPGNEIRRTERISCERSRSGSKRLLYECAEAPHRTGSRCEFFSMKTTEYMIPAYYIIASAEASSNLERFDGVKYGFRAAGYEGLHDMYYKTRTEGFGVEVKRRIMLGSFVLSSGYYDAYYLKALRTKALIKKEYDAAFDRYDVILAPAAPHNRSRRGRKSERSSCHVSGRTFIRWR